MLKTLKILPGVHQKPDATAAEIDGALAGARAEIEAAERAGAEADAAYRDGLLRLEEPELEKLIADRHTATVRRDRAVALVSALTERLAVLQAAEDQAERRARYDAARNAQAAAAKVLATEYPKLARGLVGVLRTAAEADALARVANEALPDGYERLGSVEGKVRREPNVPSRIVNDETFTAWCGPNGHRLDPDAQAKVKPGPDGVSGTWTPLYSSPVPVTLRRFRRVTTVPEAAGRSVPSLASTLNLPPLRATHTPFWRAEAAENPAGIIAAIDAASPSWGKSAGPAVIYDPEPCTEIIPLDEPADQAA
nr:hypothetical protein NG677_12115 [Methylobacterium sp. OTU13CASTA1]